MANEEGVRRTEPVARGRARPVGQSFAGTSAYSTSQQRFGVPARHPRRVTIPDIRSTSMATAPRAQKAGTDRRPAERRLRDLGGVGPAIEADFQKLGVRSVPELATCEGDELYRRLCEVTGTRQDPCVL